MVAHKTTLKSLLRVSFQDILEPVFFFNKHKPTLCLFADCRSMKPHLLPPSLSPSPRPLFFFIPGFYCHGLRQAEDSAGYHRSNSLKSDPSHWLKISGASCQTTQSPSSLCFIMHELSVHLPEVSLLSASPVSSLPERWGVNKREP